MQGNDAEKETLRRMLRAAADAVRALLPQGWGVVASPSEEKAAGAGADASIIVSAPDGQTVAYLTEVKAGQLAGAEQVLWRLSSIGQETKREVLLVAPYIGPALRERCERQGINYVDLTGWCWLKASAPALAIRAIGAAKDPRPSRASAITRLNGASAGRIIRTLLAAELPVGVRALAEQATVSAGTVSKVLKDLDSEAIVTRDSVGQVLAVRKRLLMERWTRDYSFLKTNTVGWYLAPRGVDQLVKRAAESTVWVVETGVSAARRLMPPGVLPVVGTLQVALYVPRISDVAEVFGLVPADRAAANVLLAEPYDVGLLRPPDGSDQDLPAVEPGQLLADLKTMPGRAAQLADQLMDGFAATDQGWKRS